MKSIAKNIPGVKKKQPRTKKALLKNMKSKWVAKAVFDRIKNFDHHDLTAKHYYFGCLRSPDVDGIKIFDKDDQQVAKYYSFILMFVAWSSLSKI